MSPSYISFLGRFSEQPQELAGAHWLVCRTGLPGWPSLCGQALWPRAFPEKRMSMGGLEQRESRVGNIQASGTPGVPQSEASAPGNRAGLSAFRWRQLERVLTILQHSLSHRDKQRAGSVWGTQWLSSASSIFILLSPSLRASHIAFPVTEAIQISS